MRLLFLLLIPCLAALVSCGEQNGVQNSPQPPGNSVLTTFYPTQYFAGRIGGGHLDIVCPVPAGGDPIYWKPDDAAIVQYQAADLILINGADFEKWVATASLPEGRIVNTSQSFEQDFIKFEAGKAHRHGPEGEEHTHSGIDGHTWLDPNLAKVQAATIHQAFVDKWPEHAADFGENFAGLVADLDALDEALKQIDPARPLLASHPAYNYLARRYGWKVTNLDLDPDILPPKDAVPAGHPARVILWESAPKAKSVDLLEKQHGLKSIVFSPAELEGEQDYLATMKANIERLKNALQ